MKIHFAYLFEYAEALVLHTSVGAQDAEPLVLPTEAVVLPAEAVVLHAEAMVLHAEVLVLALQ